MSRFTSLPTRLARMSRPAGTTGGAAGPGAHTPPSGGTGPCALLSKRRLASPFLAIDVETTGFSPADDRIIEIAWVVFVDGRATDGCSFLVDPRRPVPARVTEMTGLDARALAGESRFRSLAPDIVAAIARVQLVVAYNAPFDRRFVSAELARAGHVLPPVPWTDALALARTVDKKHAKGFSLAASCARHGVLLSNAHRALDDARACGELFVRLHEERAEKSLAARLIERTRALFT
jgi:DNA polymerase III epsilon subunit family exonuclease